MSVSSPIIVGRLKRDSVKRTEVDRDPGTGHTDLRMKGDIMIVMIAGEPLDLPVHMTGQTGQSIF